MGNNSNVVSSNQIIQDLKSGTQSDVTMTYSNVHNLTVDMVDTHNPNDMMGLHRLRGELYNKNPYKVGNTTRPAVDHGTHASLDVTFSNLKNWSYKGRAITKITYHIELSKNLAANCTNDFSDEQCIDISSDPTRGFSLYGLTANVTAKFFYQDGSPVNFENGTAYFAVGSLNNYQNILYGLLPNGRKNNSDGYSIEYTKVNSGGKAVGLYGSSVSALDNGYLYSVKPNSILNSDATKQHSAVLNPSVPAYSGKSATSWDYSGSKEQYYGAGLIRLSGTSLNFDAGTMFPNIPANATARNYQWWNATTLIYPTPNKTIHYHYNTTNVA